MPFNLTHAGGLAGAPAGLACLVGLRCLCGRLLRLARFNRSRHDGAHSGAYFGWWQVATKLNLALAAGVSLPLLQWLGYESGSRDAPALLALSWAYALLPCAILIALPYIFYILNNTRTTHVIQRLHDDVGRGGDDGAGGRHQNQLEFRAGRQGFAVERDFVTDRHLRALQVLDHILRRGACQQLQVAETVSQLAEIEVAQIQGRVIKEDGAAIVRHQLYLLRQGSKA